MDNNTAQTEAPIAVTNENAQPKAEVINKGNYTLEKVTFGTGKKKGFSYFFPAYLTLDAAITKFSKDGNREEGEKLVLALLNNAVKSSFSGRATQRMPAAEKDEDTNKLIAEALSKGDTLLISEKDADEWVPGTRDRVSLISLMKEFNDAVKAGDVDKAEEIMALITAEQTRKMQEMLALSAAPTPAA